MSARIAISINTSWNLYNFRRGLIEVLRTRGDEVFALAPPDDYSPRLEALGCRFVPIAMENRGTNPLSDFALLLRYRRALAEIRPGVFLGYTIKPNIYGSLAAHSLGIPVINNVSGLGTAFLEGGALQTIAETLYRRAFRRSRRVFFQNKDDEALFLARQLVQPRQTGLLPGSGIDLTHFSPVPVPPAAGRPVRFLLIARLLYDKGVGEYVEAARQLKSEGQQASFSILGFMDVDNRTAVDRATMARWVEEGVIEYLGATDDVRTHIAAADCVVLPSYREGTPRTLLEAAAMARPIVTTEVPGCRDVVDDGHSGFLCRKKDSRDLARAIERMIGLTPEARHTMGLAARAKMEAQFDERIVIARYLSKIDEILASECYQNGKSSKP